MTSRLMPPPPQFLISRIDYSTSTVISIPSKNFTINLLGKLRTEFTSLIAKSTSLDEMLVHHRVTCAVCRWYPFIHLGEERKKKWSKVRSLSKETMWQWSLNLGPPDPEFELLTAQPHMPPHIFVKAFHLIW